MGTWRRFCQSWRFPSSWQSRQLFILPLSRMTQGRPSERSAVRRVPVSTAWSSSISLPLLRNEFLLFSLRRRLTPPQRRVRRSISLQPKVATPAFVELNQRTLHRHRFPPQLQSCLKDDFRLL